MSREEQKIEISRWLRKNAQEENASVRIDSSADPEEVTILANPDGLLLLAAELIDSSMKVKSSAYLKDVEHEESNSEAITPEWLVNGSLRIIEPEEAEAEESNRNSPWVVILIVVIAFVALLILGYLYILK